MRPTANLLAWSPTLKVNLKPYNQIKAYIAHVLIYNYLQHANVLSLMVSVLHGQTLFHVVCYLLQYKRPHSGH